MRTYCIYGILIYLAAINVAAFFLYGIDKWKAQRNKWRVTEARLLWIAVAGGSIGAPAGQGHSTPQPGCDGLQAFAGAKRAKHRKGQEVAVLHPFHRTGIGRRVL